MNSIFDFIVVGGGSAGCVLAARLSENPDNRVLLLEAGGMDTDQRISMPIAFYDLLRDPSMMWGYNSEPEIYAKDRQIPLQRGKVLGGTGAINGMTYSRGDQADYNAWRDLGCEGWGYADVLPYFKRSESNWRGETAYHGGSGPVSVVRSKADQHDPFYPALLQAAQCMGSEFNHDICGESSEGFAAVEFTIDRRGRRSSSAQAFLHPALKRSNLKLEVGALASRILFKDKKAVGVEYIQHGQKRQVFARREVILSGGAYNSPQLLLLSGIGPAEELASLGIEPYHHLPGVGKNLQDHAVVSQSYAASKPVTFHKELRLDRVAVAAIRWKLFGTGPMAQLPLTCWGFRKTLASLPRADIQFFFSPVALNAEIWFPGWRKGTGHIVTARNALRYPKSRGTVQLRSRDPNDAPLTRINLLEEEEDVASLMRAIKQTRELMTQDLISGLIARELTPGDDKTSDADLEAYVRESARPSCHPSCTCAMGVGPDAVVDPQLRVYGIEGLRVADASVMPQVVGGNLNAPTMMIAEKAADYILGKAPAYRHRNFAMAVSAPERTVASQAIRSKVHGMG